VGTAAPHETISPVLECVAVGEDFIATSQSMTEPTPCDLQNEFPEEGTDLSERKKPAPIAGRINATQFDVDHGWTPGHHQTDFSFADLSVGQMRFIARSTHEHSGKSRIGWKEKRAPFRGIAPAIL
jgi:hypothetical protein